MYRRVVELQIWFVLFGNLRNMADQGPKVTTKLRQGLHSAKYRQGDTGISYLRYLEKRTEIHPRWMKPSSPSIGSWYV